MALLTVRAAAERLGIGYSTLKQWIYKGEVRTTATSGGHHRIADSEIDRLIAKTSQSTRAVADQEEGPDRIHRRAERQKPPRGFIEEVRIDGLLGQVRLRIGDQTLTAVITADAIQELKLRRGDDAVAIIKSTEVMIAREAEPPAIARRGRARR